MNNYEFDGRVRAPNEIDSFVMFEREKYHIDEWNRFIGSFEQINRYYSFLMLIMNRYEACNDELISREADRKFAPPNTYGPISMEHGARIHEMGKKLEQIELEIESFYLFSKILLDKIAHFIEFYFGRERGIGLDSHDKLVKYFDRYGTAKELIVPPTFRGHLSSLKIAISDFRDYQIAHEKRLGLFRSVSVSAEGATMAKKQVQSKGASAQVMTETLGRLDDNIRAYLVDLFELIQTNRGRSVLKLPNP